jgi:hypothetical protein
VFSLLLNFETEILLVATGGVLATIEGTFGVLEPPDDVLEPSDGGRGGGGAIKDAGRGAERGGRN